MSIEEDKGHRQDLDIEERVERGARLLDLVNPEWPKALNLITLNISDPQKCVLGELYGGFGAGETAVAEWWDEHREALPEDLQRPQKRFLVSEFGFDSEGNDYGIWEGMPVSEEMDRLTEEWKEHIKRRLP